MHSTMKRGALGLGLMLATMDFGPRHVYSVGDRRPKVRVADPKKKAKRKAEKRARQITRRKT